MKEHIETSIYPAAFLLARGVPLIGVTKHGPYWYRFRFGRTHRATRELNRYLTGATIEAKALFDALDHLEALRLAEHHSHGPKGRGGPERRKRNA